MAKLSEPVMAQISVMSSAKTLTKQARINDTESCQPLLSVSLGVNPSLAVNPRSAVKPATGVGCVGSLKMGNGHLDEILPDDRGVGASSEEISTASTEILSVRPSNRNSNQNKRDLRIRSLSADRILEEDIKFTRVAIDREDACHEHSTNNCGGARTYSKKITRQISDKSYLSWQDSETSCQDTLSIRHDSLSTRHDSLSTRHDSLSIRQDTVSTRQESVPSGPDSFASQGLSPSCASPVFNSAQSPLCVTRAPLRTVWGQRRSYTAYGGYSQYSQYSQYNWANRSSHQSMESVERLGQGRLYMSHFKQLRHSSDMLDRLPPSQAGRSRIDQVEQGLFLGNMDGATDILSLGWHRISHIVTVDSVPLPRKITSMLPRMACMHIQVTDIASEDLLSHFPTVIDFISLGMQAGVVLVHCFYGKSRSATVVTAFLMHKYKLSVEKAIERVKSKRSSVNPNPGFMAQLRLWEAMRFRLENNCLRYKMYKLHIVSEKIRKSKILSKDTVSSVIDPDPELGRCRGAAVIYKCKECRRTLATCDNILPHKQGHSPYWYSKLDRSQSKHQFCSQSVSINPISWMEDSIRSSLSGKLLCPQCNTKLGSYSWILGNDCSCGANVAPAFTLDMTTIIFKTGGRHLHTNGRQPVIV